jgi:hypothetical protein
VGKIRIVYADRRELCVIKIATAFVVMFFFSNVFGAEIKMEQQIAIAQYMVQTMQAFPDNEAGIAKLLPKMKASDAETVHKIAKSWKYNKAPYSTTSLLNQLVINVDGKPALTLETISTSPTKILVNGSLAIQIDPKDVKGSVRRTFKSAQSDLKYSPFLFSLFAAPADAAEYRTDEMSGVKNWIEAITEYGYLVSVDLVYSTSKPPWELLQTEGRTNAAINGLADSYAKVSGATPPASNTITCGKDGSASGAMKLEHFGEVRKFKQTEEALLLDDHIKIELKHEPAPRGMPYFVIQDCKDDNCKKMNLSDFVKEHPDATEKDATKKKLEEVKASIDALQNAFMKEANMEHPLLLVRPNSDGEKKSWELAETPPAGIGPKQLAKYKKSLAALYDERDKSDQAAFVAKGEYTTAELELEKDVLTDLFKRFQIARALRAGCPLNDFRAAAAENGLFLNVEGAENKTDQ